MFCLKKFILFFNLLLLTNISIKPMEILENLITKKLENMSLYPSNLYDYIYAIKNWPEEKIYENNRINDELVNELKIFNDQQKKTLESNFITNSFEIIQNIPYKSKIIYIGDIHGNLQALLSVLDKLIKQNFLKQDYTITFPDFYFVFTGDYMDRGLHDPEVLTILLKLFRENPRKVFLCKGNHEDIQMNILMGKSCLLYVEQNQILSYMPELPNLLINFYNYLPHAIYLGITNPENHKSNYILFCHGMIPKPINIIENKIRTKNKINKNKKSFRVNNIFIKNLINYLKTKKIKPYITPDLPDNLTDIIYRDISSYTNIDEFLWNDFNFDTENSYTSERSEEYFTIGTKDLKYFLQSFNPDKKLIAICRGHEHIKAPMKKENNVFTSVLSYTEEHDLMPTYNFSIINLNLKKLINFTKFNIIITNSSNQDYKINIYTLEQNINI